MRVERNHMNVFWGIKMTYKMIKGRFLSENSFLTQLHSVTFPHLSNNLPIFSSMAKESFVTVTLPPGHNREVTLDQTA